MADKTITQRIGLDGGNDVKSQLEAIGAAGKKAFNDLNDAAKAAPSLAKLGASFDALVAKAEDIRNSFGNLRASFGSLVGSITNTVRNTALWSISLGAAATGIALLLKKTAEGATGLDALGFAFSQAGVSSDKFASGMDRFAQATDGVAKSNLDFQKQQRSLEREFGLGRISAEEYTKRMDDLRFSTSQAITPFSRLGVELVNTGNAEADQRENLLRTADGFAAMGKGAEASAISMELFGKGNANFVDALSQGRAGLAQYEAEAERLMIPVGALTQEVGQKLTAAFDKLSQVSKSATVAILAPFDPIVTTAIDAIAESIAKARTSFVVLASDIANKVRPVVDDFIAVLQGRDADVHNSFVIQMRDAMIDFGQAAKSAVTDIVIPAFQTLLAILQKVADAINAVFGTKLTGGEIGIALVIAKLIGAFPLVVAGIQVVIAAVGLLVTAFGAPIVAIIAIGLAIGALIVLASTKIGSLSELWNKVWEGIKSFTDTVLNAISSAISTAWDAIKSAVSSVGTAIADVFKASVDAVMGFFGGLKDFVVGVFDSIVDTAKKIASVISDVFSSASAATSGDTGEAPPFARGGPVRAAGGGHIRGPGTGTSDSILARLSNNEYVHREKAVRKYGLPFMHAINNGQLSIEAVRAVMSSLKGFNAGGLVDQLSSGLIPGFAGGGLAVAAGGGGGRPVNINFGGQTFPAMMQGDVVDRIQRVATAKHVRSAGRKPNWFKG